MSEYLDSNSTTRCDPRVAAEVLRFLTEEFGNAGSRTHDWGARAKRAVADSREIVAQHLRVESNDLIFTSGATEANNLAILGLAEAGTTRGRNHVLVSAAEHKAVLEPAELLQTRGFEVEILPVNSDGRVEPEGLEAHLRPDTLLVSTMHVNNETGVISPLSEYEQVLQDSDAFWHVDAVQGFVKPGAGHGLASRRIDLLSISGHKIHGPKGIGALGVRRRDGHFPPLAPLMVGGGQERGLRPGTLPVPLIVGLGLATQFADDEAQGRLRAVKELRATIEPMLCEIGFVVHAATSDTVPHVMNGYLPGIDAEALMLATKESVAISNGSACTSSSMKPSHVLLAMGLSESIAMSSVRIAWDHTTDPAFVEHFVDQLRILL